MKPLITAKLMVEAFTKHAIPKDCSDLQKTEMEKCFLVGFFCAVEIFSNFIPVLPENMAVQQIEILNVEMRAYLKKLEAAKVSFMQGVKSNATN